MFYISLLIVTSPYTYEVHIEYRKKLSDKFLSVWKLEDEELKAKVCKLARSIYDQTNFDFLRLYPKDKRSKNEPVFTEFGYYDSVSEMLKELKIFFKAAKKIDQVEVRVKSSSDDAKLVEKVCNCFANA